MSSEEHLAAKLFNLCQELANGIGELNRTKDEAITQARREGFLAARKGYVPIMPWSEFHDRGYATFEDYEQSLKEPK